MIVEGEEWLRLSMVGERIPGVAESTIRVWSSRPEVRRLTVGREVWVCVEDLLTVEAASRRSRPTRPRLRAGRTRRL